MMPHPERAADKELNNQDGLTLFKSILTEILLVVFFTIKNLTACNFDYYIFNLETLVC